MAVQPFDLLPITDRIRHDKGGEGGVCLEIPTDAANGAPFTLSLARAPNSASGRRNNVLTLGYNIGQGGGRIDPSEHGASMRIESFFTPRSGVVPWSEMHFQFDFADGTAARPFTTEADVTGTNVRTRLEGTEINFSTPLAALPLISLTPASLTIWQGSTVVQKNSNNTPFLRQLNAAGNGFVELLKLNSADEVELGSLTRGPVRARRGITLGEPNQNVAAGPLLTVIRHTPDPQPFVLLRNTANGGGSIRVEGGASYNFGQLAFLRGGTGRGDLRFDTWDYSNGYVERFRVHGSAGHLEQFVPGSGHYMRSPNGTRYLVTVSNTGTLVVTPAP